MNHVGINHLESDRLQTSSHCQTQGPERFHCWAPVACVARSRWFDYFQAAPRTRGTIEGGAARSDTPARGDYLLRVIRTDLDETRRWQAIDRLSRRLLVAEAFQHPQVVPVLDSEVDAPPFFMVEPFVAGQRLAAWRNSERESCTISRMLWILRQLAELISTTHDYDRVHLAIAPEHLLVNQEGKITLTGWCQAHQSQQRAWIPQETTEDVCCLAPEATLEKYRAQTSSDIYAWGVLAYWLFANRFPFAAETVPGLIAAHRQEIPLELQVVQPLCPGPLNQLVNLALAKNPLRRPTPKYLVDCLISIEIDHLHDARKVA